MNFSENFKQALEDYQLLLNKKYPHKTILELIATRYSLNHFERSMLYRGISEKESAIDRKKRLVEASSIVKQSLHIDLFNSLFTIAAYLRGFPVYLSNDGLLRDASESHGSEDWEEHLDKALMLTIDYLEHVQPSKVYFYVDMPIERSVLVVEKVHIHFAKSMISYAIELHESPDHLLEKATEGILASSDSTVIDRSPLAVVDLPFQILHARFDKTFLNLSNILF